MGHEVEAYAPRRLTASVETTENGVTGYDVTLECGHTVWFAVEPRVSELVCAVCLDEMLHGTE